MQKSPEARYRGFVDVSVALGEVYRLITGKEPERTQELDQFINIVTAPWPAKAWMQIAITRCFRVDDGVAHVGVNQMILQEGQGWL